MIDMPYNLTSDYDIVLSTPADWHQLDGATILVTGATGRLGRHIVGALLERNRRYGASIKVIALARSRDKLDECFGSMDAIHQPDYLIQDVVDPIERIDGEVDYIFHTAGLAAPSDYVNGAVDTLWGHVQGTRNVLEFARSHKTKRVLYVSTVEVYGEWNSRDPITENDMGPLRFSNARACYPEAKRLCETMLACYKAQYDVDYVTVRMSHTAGPGIRLDDGRAFAEFINCVLHGEDIILQSEGLAARTYTYSADAIAAMFLVLTRGADHIYNVANEEASICIRDLAELIVSLRPEKGSRVRYASGVINTAVSYLPFPIGILDSSKVRALGWVPQVNLREMFERIITSFE